MITKVIETENILQTTLFFLSSSFFVVLVIREDLCIKYILV